MTEVIEQVPTTIGTPFAGGFYAGLICSDSDVYAVIVSPKDGGEHDAAVWNESTDRIAGAQSYFDGLSNTQAMAASGSEIAKWALGLNMNSFDDWYLPSRDELEVIYRAMKPTGEENYASFRDGENQSSAPVAYAYTKQVPAQTKSDVFQQGGAEAFEAQWYWTSTQCAGNSGIAWVQGFYDGDQSSLHKNYELRARAVRRLKIS
jgi:hypothetical protein